MNVSQTKVKERKLDGGSLYASVAGGRHLLAQCNLVIEAHETTQKLHMRGSGAGFTVKTCGMFIAICGDMVLSRTVDVPYLESVTSFDIEFPCVQENGTIHNMKLYGIVPIEINLNGNWLFNVSMFSKELKQLFPDLVFSRTSFQDFSGTQ